MELFLCVLDSESPPCVHRLWMQGWRLLVDHQLLLAA